MPCAAGNRSVPRQGLCFSAAVPWAPPQLVGRVVELLSPSVEKPGDVVPVTGLEACDWALRRGSASTHGGSVQSGRSDAVFVLVRAKGVWGD